MGNVRKETFEIGLATLSLDDVERLTDQSTRLVLARDVIPRIKNAHQMVSRAIASGEAVYGVTTGFGALSDRPISASEARDLQVNLLRSHAAGTGSLLPDHVVRLMLALRAHALALGYSGVRSELIQTLIDFYNHDIIPEVPSQGSVGASGDLAPLAHLALPIIGEGRVRVAGQPVEASAALRNASLEALVLEPKEALALINGTQAMTAIGACATLESRRVISAAVAAGALTVVALNGRPAAFDELLQDVRPHNGQRMVAATLRRVLDGWQPNESASRPVQDRYSIRAMPQVLGGVHDTCTYVAQILNTEFNSVTDNPLFFAEQDRIINGANFHGHPVALACDHMKTAMASLTTFSERRISSLVDPRSSNLPAFLSPNPGINSGLMIPHYVAASLVSENRVLAHPASADSLSTSADVEDYNSMGTLAARNLQTVVDNASRVVAIELICAAQAIDLIGATEVRAPVMKIYEQVRELIPFLQHDQAGVGDAIETIGARLRSGELSAMVAGIGE